MMAICERCGCDPDREQAKAMALREGLFERVRELERMTNATDQTPDIRRDEVLGVVTLLDEIFGLFA